MTRVGLTLGVRERSQITQRGKRDRVDIDPSQSGTLHFMEHRSNLEMTEQSKAS